MAFACILLGLLAGDVRDLPVLGVFGLKGVRISGIMESLSSGRLSIRSVSGRGHEPASLFLWGEMRSEGGLVFGRATVPFFFYFFAGEISLKGFWDLVGCSIVRKKLLWV